jgi:hypothetical protein
MPDTTNPQALRPVDDMRELYAVQHAITDAGGTLTPAVHRAIDALREWWDAGLRRAQAAPAAVPVPASAPTDQTALRDRIADALADADGWQWAPGYDKTRSTVYPRYQSRADAVLDRLPETTRLHDQILTLQAELASVRDVLRTENERANSAIDRETTAEEAEEEQRLALSQALGLGTGAPWDAIRDRAAELADAVPVSGPGGAADETQADPAAEELTAEEARALVDQMGLDLYRAQDAIEFARECCDIADREQRPVTTVDVREWLKGDRCTRQRAADEQPDAVSQPAVAPSVEHCIHDRTVHRTHHHTPVTGCPWCTTATGTEA